MGYGSIRAKNRIQGQFVPERSAVLPVVQQLTCKLLAPIQRHANVKQSLCIGLRALQDRARFAYDISLAIAGHGFKRLIDPQYHAICATDQDAL